MGIGSTLISVRRDLCGGAGRSGRHIQEGIRPFIFINLLPTRQPGQPESAG